MPILRALRRLDRPSALSVPTWALAFLPSVTTAVLHDRNLFGGSALLWLLAALSGTLAAGVVLWCASVITRGRHPVIVLIPIFLLAGAARGLGVGWSAEWFGLVSDPQLVVRSLSGAILAVFWLSISTLIVQGFRTHRESRMELEALERSAEENYRAATFELDTLKSRASTDIVARIRALVTEMSRVPADDRSARESLTSVAGRLHETSADVVRPLSHEVGVAAPPATTPPRPSRARAYLTILIDSVTVDPFRPGWLLALIFPSILMTAIRSYGVVLGILGAAWIVAMAAVILWWARRFVQPSLRRWTAPARAVTVVAIWVLAAGAAALPVAWSATWGVGPDRAWAVFGVPLLAYVPVTCLGIAVASAISVSWALDEDTRQSRIAVLTWQTQVLQQGIWAERKRLGRYLHGSVQAALTSTALQIETSLARGQAASDVVAAVSPTLTALVVDLETHDDRAPESVDVAGVLNQIASVWSRVAAITCDVESSAQIACTQDPDAAEKVVEIVREAITNAIRHGHSSEVLVRVAAEADGSLRIEVHDDGNGGTGGAGFGSAMLDDLCLSWSREQDRGTHLICRVATDRIDQPV